LVPTFEDLSSDFRSKAKRDYDVNIRVPIQLFDTPYKWDEATPKKRPQFCLQCLDTAFKHHVRVPLAQC